MRRAEAEGKVDVVGRGDALFERAMSFGSDRGENPAADHVGRRSARGFRRELLGRGRPIRLLVSIEAATGLPAEMLVGDELLLERRRTEPVGSAQPFPD